MSCLVRWGFALGLAVVAGLSAAADEPKTPSPAPAKEPNEAEHEALRALRDAVVDAVNGKDIDGLLKHLHPNVVVVWQNAEVSRGHKGVLEYYDKHLGRPDSTLDSYTVEPEVRELTILYGGDTGISYGTVLSHFKFKDGRTFDVNGPWSATLVKDDGHWQIASFHASVGLFDNPLVAATRNALYIGCGIAGVAGLVLGALVVWMFRKKPA